VNAPPVVYENRLGIKNRLGRVLWAVVWAVLFRPSPAPLHGWRRWLLRRFGAVIGRGAHPYPSVRVWAPWQLKMGDHSCLADGVHCYNVAPISLGDFAIVSQRSFLCAATHDHTDPEFRLVSIPIVIHDRAWVAAEAFIGPGVTVGEGAVVGARAVVVKNVDPWTVVVGNPGKRVGTRVMKA
jgi:putative colanic acid biosynthesis acetyltransferase WcaF